MITAVFAFVGAMIGSLFINYALHAPNKEWDKMEEQQYRNNGHLGPKN
jgi:hypothetical protein